MKNAMIEALVGLIEMAKEVLDGEECDHEAGICFCDWTRRLLNAEKALAELSGLRTAEQVAESGVEFVEDGDYFLKPEKNDDGGWNWGLYGDDWDRIGNAPGEFSASAAGYAAFMWSKGHHDGFVFGQSIGANNAKRQIRKALGIGDGTFEQSVVKVMDDYGVERLG